MLDMTKNIKDMSLEEFSEYISLLIGVKEHYENASEIVSSPSEPSIIIKRKLFRKGLAPSMYTNTVLNLDGEDCEDCNSKSLVKSKKKKKRIGQMTKDEWLEWQASMRQLGLR